MWETTNKPNSSVTQGISSLPCQSRPDKLLDSWLSWLNCGSWEAVALIHSLVFVLTSKRLVMVRMRTTKSVLTSSSIFRTAFFSYILFSPKIPSLYIEWRQPAPAQKSSSWSGECTSCWWLSQGHRLWIRLMIFKKCFSLKILRFEVFETLKKEICWSQITASRKMTMFWRCCCASSVLRFTAFILSYI